jgi:hypothetical protein
MTKRRSGVILVWWDASKVDTVEKEDAVVEDTAAAGDDSGDTQERLRPAFGRRHRVM